MTSTVSMWFQLCVSVFHLLALVTAADLEAVCTVLDSHDDLLSSALHKYCTSLDKHANISELKLTFYVLNFTLTI